MRSRLPGSACASSSSVRQATDAACAAQCNGRAPIGSRAARLTDAPARMSIWAVVSSPRAQELGLGLGLGLGLRVRVRVRVRVTWAVV